jgi:hypothetical protein
MSLRTRRSTVMAAQGILNLVPGFGAPGVRLPLPEDDESLSAHATMAFSVPVRALAEDLHLSTPRHSCPGSGGATLTNINHFYKKQSSIAAWRRISKWESDPVSGQ